MKYLGGKTRISYPLMRYLQPFVDKASAYVEPFVGGASVICRIHHPVRYGSDLNQSLITLYTALQNGWEPPSVLTEREWLELKQKKDMFDPLTAFAGFGCSYSGMWFHSYANDKQQTNYALLARNALLNKFSGFRDVTWSCSDYKNVVIPDGAVVYCDPPYMNTFQYESVNKFSSTDFWAWTREISQRATVFVSEYNAPKDMDKVFSITKRLGLHTKEGTDPEREECLFTPNTHITNFQLRKEKPVGLIARRIKI